MSNERLERIKERVNYHGHLDDDIEFLIKQAEQNEYNKKALINQEKSSDREIERLRERVQELEEQLKDRDSAISTGIHVSNLIKKQNKSYREALEFINEELELVLHSNKGLAEKMFYIENSKRKITEVLEGESNE